MRHRTPNAKARVTGADTRNPARFRGRNDPSGIPLGAPSPRLSQAERDCWELFVAEIPWLVESDRALVEVASALRAKMASRDSVGVNHLQIYSAVLSKLGATPADRSRVMMPSDDHDDDEFFGD